MASEAQKAANKRYREKMKSLTIEFSPAESDLFEFIQQQKPVRTYIKNLIREDMKTKRENL